MDVPAVLAIRRDADATRVTLTLAIPASLNVFDGHFDGAPIVPGVAQINWALALANQHLRPIAPAQIAHMEAVKFQHVMVPDSDVALELELSGNKLLFAFMSSAAAVRYSSGKVVLDA